MTKGVFEVNGIHHSSIDNEKLLELTAHAEIFSTHPIAFSIRNAWLEGLVFGPDGEPLEKPAKSDERRLDRERVGEVQEISGNGIIAEVDGKQVAAGNTKLMESLGAAYIDCRQVGTIVHVALDGVYAGHLLISDVVKPTAKEAIRALHDAGVTRTVMLTGDARKVGEAVAKEIGIDEVRAELLPGDKVAAVEELLANKPENAVLAFVGDGINDAPVLTRADVGIAMGALGSDAAIEAADVVLMDDEPKKIALAIRIAKKCMRIVYENIWFAIGVKVICLVLGALGIASMWLAIFADVGVMVLAVSNAIRAMFTKKLRV
jgi:Cd2+/Zn2+-exporting ATPase